MSKPCFTLTNAIVKGKWSDKPNLVESILLDKTLDVDESSILLVYFPRKTEKCISTTSSSFLALT